MREPMPVGVAIFLIVAGLILGTVFIFGMQFWGESIDREEAIQESGVFESYQIHYGRHRISEIKIILNDHRSFYIDGACVTDELQNQIEALPKGAKVDMLIHPNSDTIWELKRDDHSILSFERSQEQIKGENIGFAALGLFMYFCVVLGIGSLLMRWRRGC